MSTPFYYLSDMQILAIRCGRFEILASFYLTLRCVIYKYDNTIVLLNFFVCITAFIKSDFKRGKCESLK